MEDVGKPSGLVRRQDSASWQFRQRWPKHLRRPGDPAEIWISLETTSYRDALAKLPEVRDEMQRRFNHADTADEREGIYSRTPSPRWPDDQSLPLLRSGEVASLAQAFFAEVIRGLDAEAPAPWSKGDDGWQSWRSELEDLLARLTGPETAESDDLVVSATIRVLRNAGLRAEPGDEASNLLHNLLRRALAQSYQIMLSRLDGNYSDRITDRVFENSLAAGTLHQGNSSWFRSDGTAPMGVKVQSLGNAAETYLLQLLAEPTTDKTKDRYRAEIKHIVAFFGVDMPVWRIDADECERLRDSFALLPPNFEDKVRGGRDIAAIVASRGETDPTLAWATLKKYLSQLTRFLDWAHRRDYIAKNYAFGLKPLAIKPDGSMAKLPFEDEELRRIVQRPIYTGCKNDRRGFSKPGPNIVRRARYWAPLISLYGGLRCGEILQLTTEHIRVSPEGNDFIVLTSDMKLKTENAVREIPLHPILKAIGFVDWVARKRERGELALFPEVPAHSDYDDHSTRFSKWYESDLRHFELGERRQKLTFHSYRHTFKRALDRADVWEEKKEQICGWARAKKTGRRYGTGLEADVLKPCVDAVKYDIDLSHLYEHAKLTD